MSPLDRYTLIVRGHGAITPIGKLVLLTIANHINARHGESCFPSQALLARETGLSVRTIIATVAELVHAGHVSLKRGNRRAGHANVYTVHPQLQVHEVHVNQVHMNDDQVKLVQHQVQSTAVLGAAAAHQVGNEVEKEVVNDQPSAKSAAAGDISRPSLASSKRKKAKSKIPTPEGYADTMAHFLAVFERVKGCKPGEMDRNGNALKRLLANHPPDDVRAMIDRAGENTFWATQQPNLWTIANNPDGYRGIVAKPPMRSYGPQKQVR